MRGGAHPDDATPAHAEFDHVDERGDAVDGDDRIRGPRCAALFVDQTNFIDVGVDFESSVVLLLVAIVVRREHVHFPEFHDVGGKGRRRDEC